MHVFPQRYFLIVIFVCFPAFLGLACPDVRAGDLDAAPWTRVVGKQKQSLPGKYGLDIFAELERGEPSKMEKLAEEGYPRAATLLADYSRRRLKNTTQSVHWLRTAVRNGDVDSAFALGHLYFPLGGTLGRADFEFIPDAALGYAWYAIGLSGLKTLEREDGKAEMEMRRARNAAEGLRRVLLPSERVRAAAILAKWPEELPPDTLLEPMRGEKRGNGNAEDMSTTAFPDANAVIEVIRQWTTGKTKNPKSIEALFVLSGELEQILQHAFERMETLAAAGDKEAKYMVAWCRLHGLGTEADVEAAQPAIQARAEKDDPEAMFLMSICLLEQEDKDRAIDYAVGAAEKGHGRAMLLLAEILRDRGDREVAARWLEKAAEAGEAAAVEEMIRITQSDWEKLVQWVTVAMIRTRDPARAYRCRMLIDYAGTDVKEESLQKAMDAGVRWDEEYPAPAWAAWE